MAKTDKAETAQCAAILDEAIERSGKSQEAIAVHLNIEAGNIYQWRTGRRPVPAEREEMLAELVGASPGDISPKYRRQLDARAHAAAISATRPNFEPTRQRAPEWVQVPFYPTAAVAAGGDERKRQHQHVDLRQNCSRRPSCACAARCASSTSRRTA